MPRIGCSSSCSGHRSAPFQHYVCCVCVCRLRIGLLLCHLRRYSIWKHAQYYRCVFPFQQTRKLEAGSKLRDNLPLFEPLPTRSTEYCCPLLDRVALQLACALRRTTLWGCGHSQLEILPYTMRFLLIGQNRSMFIGNLALFWICFDRIIANA